MPECENCGKESKDLRKWFVYDTDTKEVKIKKVCPECQEEYKKQAEESEVSQIFQKKMEERKE